MKRLREHPLFNAATAVLLIALVVRLGLFFIVSARYPVRFLRPDSLGYMQLAENVVKHHAYSMSQSEPLAPEHSRTPLYPLFISFFTFLNLGIESLIMVQILMSLLLCLAAVLITFELSGSKTAAFGAGMFTALDVPSLMHANLVLTETLFTLLLVLGVWFFMQHWKQPNPYKLPGSAFCLGLLVLCRPVAFLLPFLLLLLLAFQPQVTVKRRLYNAGLFLVIYMFTLSPWLLRNKAVFGFPFISTIGYENLLTVQGGGIRSVADNIPYEKAKEVLKEEFERSLAGSNPGMQETLQLKKKMAVALIRQHPAIYARNYVKAVANMLFLPLRSDVDLMLGLTDKASILQSWGGSQGENILIRFFHRTSFATILITLFQMIVLGLMYAFSLLGLAFAIGRRRSEMIIIFVIIFYFCIMSGAPETYARFRVPLVPFFSVLAGAGLFRLQEFLNARKKV